MKIKEVREYLVQKATEINEYLGKNGHKNVDVAIEIWKDYWDTYYLEVECEHPEKGEKTMCLVKYKCHTLG